MKSFRSTSLAMVLMFAVAMLGCFAAPFAEAGTLAVNQAYIASTPNHDLTAITANPKMTLVPSTGQRSTDATEATILTAKTKMIGGIAMATFTSASYSPSVAMQVHRSPGLHTSYI